MFKPVLRNRLVIKVIIADSISEIGSKITYFALVKKVYEISGGSVVDLGFLTISQVLPYILFGPFAGVLVDRISRRNLIVAADFCSGLAILLLIFVKSLPAVVVIAFLTSFFWVFKGPAKKAIEPNLVEKTDIPALNSFKSLIASFVYVAGFALGASTVAFLGVTTSFLIDATTFFLSGIILASMRVREDHLKLRKPDGKTDFRITNAYHSFITDLKTGIKLVHSNASLKLVMILDMSLALLFSAQSVLVYTFVRETLHGGAKSELLWGTFMSARGIGSIVGSILIGSLVKKHKNRFKIFLNILLWDGAVLAIFSVNTYLPVSIVASFLSGIICASPIIILNTILQETVSDEHRGKVSSLIETLGSPLAVISVFIGTVIASRITAQGALLLFACLEIIAVFLVYTSSAYKNVKEKYREMSLLEAPVAAVTSPQN